MNYKTIPLSFRFSRSSGLLTMMAAHSGAKVYKHLSAATRTSCLD